MKAAVIYQQGAAPVYTDMPDRQPAAAGEVVAAMKAVAIAGHERSVAQGMHYSARQLAKPEIPGRMGVGVLPDGRRAAGICLAGGMLAERALMREGWIALLPEGLSEVTAAALLNAVIGSALPLLYRAGLQAGETVWIHGATGFTGALAVQLARRYGAGRIIATGRNSARLQELRSLGADETVSLEGEDDAVRDRLRATMQQAGAALVLDYLWGRPGALLLEAAQGAGPLRYVSVGAVAGGEVPLVSELLRSTDLRIMGSGQGSLSREAVRGLFAEVLPEVFGWAAAGKLAVPTVTATLDQVEAAFYREVPAGQRLVITM